MEPQLRCAGAKYGALPGGRFYQFRLALAHPQAKGSFKIRLDRVADALHTGVVLPVSSVKPECKGPSTLIVASDWMPHDRSINALASSQVWWCDIRCA
ncbi:MAG: hypothetical protein R2762_26410 [Bryobacteraceae bacterium]